LSIFSSGILFWLQFIIILNFINHLLDFL